MESQIIMTLSLPSTRKSLVLLCGTAVLATVSGCGRNNEIDVSAGVGITATRSKCPAVAVPLHTGDITLFDPATSRGASAIRSEERRVGKECVRKFRSRGSP